MQVLILTASLLAVASAGFYGHQHQQAHFPIHIPVIGPKGVPLEPLEVANERNAHLAYYAYTKARNHGHLLSEANAHVGFSEHIPVIGPYGIPFDTPEVAAAKYEHYVAHAKAASQSIDHGYDQGYNQGYNQGYGHGYGEQHYRKRRGIIGHSGHGAAITQQSSVVHHPAVYATYHHEYPALGHDGQPLETHDVVALKKAHFAAHAEAKARTLLGHGAQLNAGYGHGNNEGAYVPTYAHGADTGISGYSAANIHYGAGNAFGAHGDNSGFGAQGAGYGFGHGVGHVGSHGEGVFYDGSQGYHIPVIHDGVPLETPEVIAAKKHHFAALAEAHSRSHGTHDEYDNGNSGNIVGNTHYGAGNAAGAHGANYGLGLGHVSSHGEGIFYDGSKGYHIPVIHHGVPLETPEVVAAKKHHFAALAEAHSRSHGKHGGYQY